jgi:hypothetical protein
MSNCIDDATMMQAIKDGVSGPLRPQWLQVRNPERAASPCRFERDGFPAAR